MLRHTLNPRRIRLPLVLLSIVVFYSASPLSHVLEVRTSGNLIWRLNPGGEKTLTIRKLGGGERLVWCVEAQAASWTWATG